MANYRTQGYDIAFEISEAMVSSFVGGGLPGVLSGQSGEIVDDLASGRFAFIDPAAAASVSLNAPGEDTASLDIPFRFSATFVGPAEWPDTVDISGHLTVLTPVIIFESTATIEQAAFDFRGLDADSVEVVSHGPLPDTWSSLVEPLLGLIERIVQRSLVAQNWYAVPLPLPIDPDNDGSDPFMPLRVDVRVVRDGEARSIMLLFSTSPHTTGDPGAITETALDPTWNSACIIGNELLLRRIVGASLLEGLGLLDPAAPDPIETLNGLLDYAENRVTLSSSVDLRHMVDEWWASRADLHELVIQINDSETLDVRARILAGGPFVETSTTVHMTASMAVLSATQIVLHWHVDEPEVVIVPGPLAWVIAGPLAAIVFALKGVATEFIFGVLENILSADCELVGLEEWPEDPQPVDIDCNVTIPWPIPLLVDDIILDDWATVGQVNLLDTIYEWPEPHLEIIGNWVAGDGEFGGGSGRTVTAGVWANCFSHYLQHIGDFRAMPVGAVIYPVDYAWCLGGHTLTGSGTLHLDDTSISYESHGDRLSLNVELGGSLDSELCVSAIDARGTELFARRAVMVEGEERFCHFVGVERLEGPPPELHQPGAYVAEMAMSERFASPAQDISRNDYGTMMRVALARGMGVDPGDPSVRRPP